jgi:hypothetical protein
MLAIQRILHPTDLTVKASYAMPKSVPQAPVEEVMKT